MTPDNTTQLAVHNKVRYHARRMAIREQRRIGLADRDTTQLEEFLVHSICRYLHGEPPIPLPDYWLDLNLERWVENYLKTSYVGRLTRAQLDAAEFSWKLRHFDALAPDERTEVAVRAHWEAKQSLLEGERDDFSIGFRPYLMSEVECAPDRAVEAKHKREARARNEPPPALAGASGCCSRESTPTA